MSWNFNIDEAPRGKYETKTITNRDGKKMETRIFVPDMIIAAGKCGVVTKAYWIDPQQRWAMFGEDEAPIAWQDWPKHPEKETA